MTKRKKITIITNLAIAAVLIGLGIAVFTTNIADVFISVGAPIYNGNRSSSQISLMFVVEDDAGYLTEITDTLKSKNVPATFFIGGSWASKNRDTVKRIAEDFELGNHAYNDQSLAKLKEGTQYNEIADCHSMVYAITSSTQVNMDNIDGVQAKSGVEMKLFLPPNGSFNKTTLKCAEKLGYRTVMWSVDATAGSVYDKAAAVTGGDFILLHPNLATFAALNSILREYNSKNLTLVKLSENIG